MPPSNRIGGVGWAVSQFRHGQDRIDLEVQPQQRVDGRSGFRVHGSDQATCHQASTTASAGGDSSLTKARFCPSDHSVSTVIPIISTANGH